MQLAQDRIQCQDLVNMVVNVKILYKQGFYP
jgi:hypothetical protein